ncbi:TPA: hypothetical protein ACLGYK_004202, partial [Salmonella enterica]
ITLCTLLLMSYLMDKYPLKPDIFPMPCFYNLRILSAMRTVRLKKSSRALAALTFFGWTP